MIISVFRFLDSALEKPKPFSDNETFFPNLTLDFFAWIIFSDLQGHLDSMM